MTKGEKGQQRSLGQRSVRRTKKRSESNGRFDRDWNERGWNGENWSDVAWGSHTWTETSWENEYFSHGWTSGFVFLLPEKCDSEPERVRIVGDIEDLGDMDPQDGLDLCWEGDVWRSMVVPIEPGRFVNFHVVRLEQPIRAPGLLQGWQRWEMHEQRKFTWSPRYEVRAPGRNEILQIHISEKLQTEILRRDQVVTAPHRHLWQQPGQLRCFTFDGPVVLKYCLYLPPFDEDLSLVLFLHSMHGSLEGDNNLFFESDTPLRLLYDDPRCPQALRERCVLLVPQCPTDRDRGDGAGVWLRKGWYEESSYDQQVEEALMSLTELVQLQYSLRRVVVVGSSMGAYGALELCARRPHRFAAAALIAAHYDLEPMEPLVQRLTEQRLSLWFIHARNDQVCPYTEIEKLVESLRAQSSKCVWLTTYEDTWSSQGHCADCVAFWTRPVVPGAPALGEPLFRWLTAS